MIPRLALHDVRSALDTFPVVALLGPRQVKKTTLAHTVAEALRKDRVRYVELESPTDRARLTDAHAYFEAQRGRLVILDEIHRTPELFALLRGVVDRRRRSGLRTGQFLVIGSASLDLLRQSSVSLAGRIGFVELTPIGIEEIRHEHQAIDRLWLRGGFPDSLFAKSDAVGKRLVKSPKVYVRDSGIVRALLGLEGLEDVLGHPVAGPSWEGMVVESVLIAAAGEAPMSFYRTNAGAEVDIVIEGRRSRTYAIEIKRSTAPALAKGFWNGRDDIGAREALVIYPGDERIPLGDRVEAMGLHDAIQWVRDRVS